MNPFSRIVLGLCSIFVAGYFTLMLTSFSRLAEQNEYGIGVIIFSIIFATIFASGLWLPLIIPNNKRILGKVIRRISLILLMFPTFLYGSIVLHRLNRWRNGLIDANELLFGLAPFTVCIIGAIIHLFYELKTFRAAEQVTAADSVRGSSGAPLAKS